MGDKIQGQVEFERKLKQLSNDARRKIANPVINAGLRVLADGIKSQIPPEYVGLASLVGKRIDRSGSGNGEVIGKVGFGVGRRGSRTKSRKRGGVGISANNIHWLVLGTKERATKTGANRGVMPAVLAHCVPNGIAYSNAAAITEMERVFKEQMKNL
jgi:hypothetical protein